MPSSTRSGPRSRRGALVSAAGSAAAGASWMALVAATTLGLAPVQRLRAEVSVKAGKLSAAVGDEYRLIVQSYSPANVVNGVPVAHARPLASTQRSVTPDELRSGVAVDVVSIGDGPNDDSVLVAWLERGSANLDFDGRRARPGRGAYLGVAAAEQTAAHIVLSREVA